MSIKKNKNQLIISIIVGMAIAVISYQVIIKLKIENDNLKKLAQTSSSVPLKKITYVVAKNDIKKGDRIETDNLTTKQFPIEIEGAVTNPSKISGVRAIKDIKADSPIVEDYFRASDLDFSQNEPRSGFRALGINPDVIPYFVKAGVLVDVYFAKNSIQAQGVRVLSVDDTQEASKKTIMLEIKDRDVPVFLNAMSGDKPVLVQRNRHEKTGYRFSYDSSPVLSQLPRDDSVPPELVEVSDVSYSEPVKKTASKPAPKQEKEIPIVKSQAQKTQEIELITGDKRVIVGAMQ